MKKTKFNLERALKGEKVVTRAGHEVVHLINIKVKGYDDLPVFALIKGKDNEIYKGFYTIDGYFHSSKHESSYDLFMLTETKLRFANVYELMDGHIVVDKELYETYYKAKKSIKNKNQYIKTISL
jgi:hypothetical protein